jgi:hypothetical protein
LVEALAGGQRVPRDGDPDGEPSAQIHASVDFVRLTGTNSTLAFAEAHHEHASGHELDADRRMGGR